MLDLLLPVLLVSSLTLNLLLLRAVVPPDVASPVAACFVIAERLRGAVSLLRGAGLAAGGARASARRKSPVQLPRHMVPVRLEEEDEENPVCGGSLHDDRPSAAGQRRSRQDGGDGGHRALAAAATAAVFSDPHGELRPPPPPRAPPATLCCHSLASPPPTPLRIRPRDLPPLDPPRDPTPPLPPPPAPQGQMRRSGAARSPATLPAPAARPSCGESATRPARQRRPAQSTGRKVRARPTPPAAGARHASTLSPHRGRLPGPEPAHLPRPLPPLAAEPGDAAAALATCKKQVHRPPAPAGLGRDVGLHHRHGCHTALLAWLPRRRARGTRGRASGGGAEAAATTPTAEEATRATALRTAARGEAVAAPSSGVSGTGAVERAPLQKPTPRAPLTPAAGAADLPQGRRSVLRTGPTPTARSSPTSRQRRESADI